MTTSNYTPYTKYFRPLAQVGPVRPPGAVPLAGGAAWFTHAEMLRRDAPPRIVSAQAIPSRALICLSAPRAPIAGLMMDQPHIMGILNVTPDSFSDGGEHPGAAHAAAHGRAMVSGGAQFIDIGGESTRPGALEVPAEAEIARVVPTIEALRSGLTAPISIDTRKRAVAEEAVAAGAQIVNDVSGFTFDKTLAKFCADQQLSVCIMHSPGVPEVMQEMTDYDNLLLDIYDFLGHQIARLESIGIPRARMIIDPGLGFGKTLSQNLEILAGLTLFHGHGVPLLIGASRKGFIREIGGATYPKDRMPGSVAVALDAVAKGAQIVRVHDVAETRQALRLAAAVQNGAVSERMK